MYGPIACFWENFPQKLLVKNPFIFSPFFYLDFFFLFPELHCQMISDHSVFPRKIHIFWKGHNILRNIHCKFDWHYISRTNLRWRFCKVLWPSQNIWTLKTPKFRLLIAAGKTRQTTEHSSLVFLLLLPVQKENPFGPGLG